MSTSLASSSTGSPCAACKFLRRKCTPDCAFSPYFPPDQPQRFASVHKVFGASNVSKLINEVHVHQREDAVNSLVYEAEARLKDPVYGCVGIVSLLQHSVVQLQTELAMARSELSRYAAARSVVTGNAVLASGKGIASPYSQPDSGPCSTVLMSPALTGVSTVAGQSLGLNIAAASAQLSGTSAARSMAGPAWDTPSISMPITNASDASRIANIQDEEILHEYTAAAPHHNSFCKMEPP